MSESLYPIDQANDLLYLAHSLIRDAHYKVTSPEHAKMFSRLRVLLDGIEIPPKLASLYHDRELPRFGKWETTSYLAMVVLIAKQLRHLIERQHAGKGTLSAKAVQEHWEHYSALVPLGSELFQRHALGKRLKVEHSEFARRQGTKTGGKIGPQSEEPASPRPSESKGTIAERCGKPILLAKRTRLLGVAEAATYMGRDRKWLNRVMHDDKSIAWERKTRQSYIFCLDDFPPEIHAELRPRTKKRTP